MPAGVEYSLLGDTLVRRFSRRPTGHCPGQRQGICGEEKDNKVRRYFVQCNQYTVKLQMFAKRGDALISEAVMWAVVFALLGVYNGVTELIGVRRPPWLYRMHPN